MTNTNQPVSGARFEVYRDYEGRYRWRLRDSKARIAADSPASYASSEAALFAAREAKAEARLAQVVQ